jgi:hypothetical protein
LAGPDSYQEAVLNRPDTVISVNAAPCGRVSEIWLSDQPMVEHGFG